MSGLCIPQVEKRDIQLPPSLQAGDSIIVLERHEQYQVDPAAQNAGSLLAESAAAAFDRDVAFFEHAFAQGAAQAQATEVLFMASDTQYAGKGYRAMETTWIAQNAALHALSSMGMSADEGVINLSADRFTPKFRPANLAEPVSIWPDARLREPQIFDNPAYITYLLEKYGSAEDNPTRLSQQAWAAHESDAEQAMREKLGAEGVYDILSRTKRSLSLMSAYSRRFHMTHPDSRLIVWAGSHYDTISPLVKDAVGIDFSEFIPVAYGGGVVIKLAAKQGPVLRAQGKDLELRLGNITTEGSVQA